MASVKERYPDALRFVVLVDDLEDEFDPDREDFVVIPSDILRIPNSLWFQFKYSILELNTAVKPYAIDYLFTQHNLDRVFYLDPDIWLLDSLADLEALLNDSDIILTPHLTLPLPDDGKTLTELDILRAGAYNLGFIGLAHTPNALRFLKWWQGRVYDHCYVDFGRGLFTDQKWIDLVPGLFDRVHITRNPRFNTAYWNLPHRTIKKIDNRFTVDDLPLCFFHFSGFDPLNPTPFSKHQNRFTLADLGDARDLALGYAVAVLSHGHNRCKSWRYAYATFKNGERIVDHCRRFAANTPLIAARVSDPFSAAGFAQYIKYWNAPISLGTQSVPRIAYDIYAGRSDAQRAYPDISGNDRVPFLNWFLHVGEHEYRFPEHFLAPIRTIVCSSTTPSRVEQECVTSSVDTAAVRTELSADPLRDDRRELGVLLDRRPAQAFPEGLNIVGYVKSHTGVGQAGRCTVAAAATAGIPVNVNVFEMGDISRKSDHNGAATGCAGFDYDINLYNVNADQTAVLFSTLPPSAFAKKYNIGYWNWEVEDLPDEHVRSFSFLNEV